MKENILAGKDVSHCISFVDEWLIENCKSSSSSKHLALASWLRSHIKQETDKDPEEVKF